MNLLDRFRKRRRVSEVSEDPTTFFMMESIQDSVETALNPVNPFSPHYQLGPLQHLLVLSYPEDQLKAYLLKYKEAADVIMYCQYRFNGQTIPAELHYLHKKIADVVHTHEQQITGKKNNGVRNFIRSYLKIHKVDLNLKMLFEQKNNDLLLEKLSSAVQIINHKEENYISVRKADFLLQELWLFDQNHCSASSYLYYDRMDGKNWSQGTKFALSYLSSDVPLDNLRLELLINILSEIPSEKEENYFPKAYRFAMKVEDETLAYGLNLLSRKTKDLKNTVRDTLRDRFTERHAMYWFSLKDRVYSLTYNSANPNSLDFQDTERQPFISESSPLTPLE